MTTEPTYVFTVRSLGTGSEQQVELRPSERDLSIEGRLGWSVGPASRQPRIVVAEVLPEEVRLGIFFMSNHIVLMGMASVPDLDLPPIGVVAEREGEPHFTPWLLRTEVDGGQERLYCRFDYHALRLGNHEIRL